MHGRAGPNGSKQSGQLTLQLKVEKTAQYFINQDNESLKPIDNVSDYLSISQHEENVANGRTKIYPLSDGQSPHQTRLLDHWGSEKLRPEEVID